MPSRVLRIVLLLILGSTSVLWAQDAVPPLGGVVLSEQQQRGMELFVRSCATCHGATLFVAGNHNNTGLFGPPLWNGSLGGDDAALAAYIAQGSLAMPGFALTFSDEEMAAIVAFLKVLPEPQPLR